MPGFVTLLRYAKATRHETKKTMFDESRIHFFAEVPDRRCRSSEMLDEQGNDKQSSIVKFKVAVLEDDAELREDILIPQLRQFGFDTRGFETAEELLRAAETASFDLIVLGAHSPKVDGFTIAHTLREKAIVGVVALTGTLHGVVRRMQKSAKEGDASMRWSLAGEGWRLHEPDGRSMALNAAERRLLARLFEANGKLVAYDELIALLVTAAEDADQHRLEMLIHRLRRKVSANLGKTLPLRAVRGRGFVFFNEEPSRTER